MRKQQTPLQHFRDYFSQRADQTVQMGRPSTQQNLRKIILPNHLLLATIPTHISQLSHPHTSQMSAYPRECLHDTQVQAPGRAVS